MAEVVNNDVVIRQFAVLFSKIDGVVLEAVDDKKRYLDYIKRIELNYTNDEEQELVILKLLEDNGFSIDRLGTYLYKDVIKRIMDSLKKVRNEEEILELKNEVLMPYSQFYFDISRNEKDMGVKTFHSYIEDTFANIDSKPISLFIKNIFSRYQVNYGEVAFLVAITLVNYGLDKNSGVNSVKKRFRESDLF